MAYVERINRTPHQRDQRIERSVDEACREVASAQAAEVAARGAKIAEAVELVDRLSVERLASLGEPHNLNAAQARKQLLSLARSRPELVAKTLAREFAQ